MKKLISICFTLCVAVPAMAQDQILPLNGPPAEKVLATYDWKDLMARNPSPHFEVVSMDGISVLKVENTNSTPLELSLLTVTNSSIAQRIKSISWDMKYPLVYGKFDGDGIVDKSEILGPSFEIANNSRGDAGLELLSIVPPNATGGDVITNASRYYIFGSSNWKQRNLAVYAGQQPSVALELRIYLPAQGTVYLRPLKLMGRTQNWWSAQTAGLIGGIGGSLIGSFGALIGILASMGKGRRFVLTTTTILIVSGILLVIGGVTAVAMKQPYAVWYPLILGGAILTFVLSINLYSIRRRYDDLEIRRMTSMDATGR